MSKWTVKTAVIFPVLSLNLSTRKRNTGEKKTNHRQNVVIEEHKLEFIVNCDMVGLHGHRTFPLDKHIYSPSFFKCTVSRDSHRQ